MSARNGDKARFGKQRKRKMAHRARTRDLRENLPPSATTQAAPTQTVPVPGHSESAFPETPSAEAVSSEPLAAPPAVHSEGSGAEAAHGEHHGVLDSAAGAIGSVLGSIASKVKVVRHSDPIAAE